MLKYTYVFGFYLGDGPEKKLFEYLQEKLERSTDRLAELTEAPVDRMDRTEVRTGACEEVVAAVVVVGATHRAGRPTPRATLLHRPSPPPHPSLPTGGELHAGDAVVPAQPAGGHRGGAHRVGVSGGAWRAGAGAPTHAHARGGGAPRREPPHREARGFERAHMKLPV